MQVQPVVEEDDLEVVRQKSFDLKPMDSEEAILQMNLLRSQLLCLYKC